MKKRIIITTEKREVWIIRRAESDPKAEANSADDPDGANESLAVGEQVSTAESRIRPEESESDAQ